MDNKLYISLPFETRSELDSAVKQINDSNIEIIDIISSSQPKSANHIKKISTIAGLVSVITPIVTILVFYYLNTSYYPMITGGISAFSIIPLVPLIFEITILTSVLSIFLSFLYYSKLPSKAEKDILSLLNKSNFQILIDRTHAKDIEQMNYKYD